MVEHVGRVLLSGPAGSTRQDPAYAFGWTCLRQHAWPAIRALWCRRGARPATGTLPLAFVGIPTRATVRHEEEDRCHQAHERDKQREELKQQHGSIVRPCDSGDPFPAPAPDCVAVETELGQYLVGVLAQCWNRPHPRLDIVEPEGRHQCAKRAYW
jgi:hypothetical protein